MFLLRGYKYVSLVDVADEVGITKGGIYHYFSSKEELLKVSVHRLFDDLKKKYLSIFEQNKKIHDILESIIVEQEFDIYFKSVFGIEQEIDCINGVSFILEVMQCYPGFHQKIDENHVEICAAIASALERGIQNGEIRNDIDVNAISVVIFTVIHGHGPAQTFYKTKESRIKIFDSFYKLIQNEAVC